MTMSVILRSKGDEKSLFIEMRHRICEHVYVLSLLDQNRNNTPLHQRFQKLDCA